MGGIKPQKCIFGPEGPTMGPRLGPYFRVDLPEKTRKNTRLTRNRLAKAVGGLGG